MWNFIIATILDKHRSAFEMVLPVFWQLALFQVIMHVQWCLDNQGIREDSFTDAAYLQRRPLIIHSEIENNCVAAFWSRIRRYHLPQKGTISASPLLVEMLQTRGVWKLTESHFQIERTIEGMLTPFLRSCCEFEWIH